MKLFSVMMLTMIPVRGLAAQAAADWSTNDRVVIGDFTKITSVASAQDRVYVTSPLSLLIWNPQFRHWDLPITPPDPTTLDRVFVSLVDPLDNSLWLGRVDGWVHYDPSIQLWDRGTVPGGVQEIAFDQNAPVSGLFLRSGNSWYIVPRGGNAAIPASAPARPLRPATVRDAITANPTLQSNGAAFLMNSQLTVARFTVAARSFDGLGWYIGTWGVGLLYLQDGGAFPERLTFGIPGSTAGALFTAPGGVWVSTDKSSTSEQAGLAFVASDLSEFNWIQGPTGFGLPFAQVRRIIGLERDLWAATEQGLAKVDPESGHIDLFNEARGLPDNRVYAVTARRGKLAVGTARGLSVLHDKQLERVAPDYVGPVYALAFSSNADSIWVGTPRGVFIALPGESGLVLPMELSTAAALGEPVVGLTWQGDTLMALTEDRLIWRDPRLKSWWLGPTLSTVLGRLRAFAPGEGGVWIAGEQGVGFVPFNALPARTLRFPADLPGEPVDLALDDDFLWIATQQGLVRFRLEAIRP
jgi:hypothetical protein